MSAADFGAQVQSALRGAAAAVRQLQTDTMSSGADGSSSWAFGLVILVLVLISRRTDTIRMNAPASLGMSYHPAA